MSIQIKIDSMKYELCKECGVYHKTSKGKRNKKKAICTRK